MYKYFVSYAWDSRTKTGFGNCSISRNKKIESIQDTKEIAEDIKNLKNLAHIDDITIVVLNYILFD